MTDLDAVCVKEAVLEGVVVKEAVFELVTVRDRVPDREAVPV